MNPVITPLLVAGLIDALVGHALVSGVLIVKLGRFDDAQRKADEAGERAKTVSANVEKLQTEVDKLPKLRDILVATVADWEQRLKQKAAAAAAAAALAAQTASAPASTSVRTRRPVRSV